MVLRTLDGYYLSNCLLRPSCLHKQGQGRSSDLSTKMKSELQSACWYGRSKGEIFSGEEFQQSFQSGITYFSFFIFLFFFSFFPFFFFWSLFNCRVTTNCCRCIVNPLPFSPRHCPPSPLRKVDRSAKRGKESEDLQVGKS